MSNRTETTSSANVSVPEAVRQLLTLVGNQVSDHTSCVVVVNVNINQPVGVNAPLPPSLQGTLSINVRYMIVRVYG